MLQNHLLAGEDVVFRTQRPVSYGKEQYQAYVTGQRLLLYRKVGMVFAREDLQSFRLGDIAHCGYKEEGIITRRGVMEIHVRGSKIRVGGHALHVKQLYQHVLAGSQKEPVAA